jgi:uncharacterized protein (TIGR03663 family)
MLTSTGSEACRHTVSSDRLTNGVYGRRLNGTRFDKLSLPIPSKSGAAAPGAIGATKRNGMAGGRLEPCLAELLSVHRPAGGASVDAMPFLRWLPLMLVAVLGFWLRTRDLERRPMHADEANQAVKLGELLDRGHYSFDPRDHHGPTLYYAALPMAWARGEHSLATLTEKTVRLVPAFFGTVSILLLVALGTALCRDDSEGDAAPSSAVCWPALAAGMFMAVSPPAVYYSRYFIQESLLVTFTLATVASVRNLWRSGLTRWAIAAGASVGLMQATKASAPLFLFAAFVAATMASRFSRHSPNARRDSPERDNRSVRSRSRLQSATIALLAALVTASLLYSSFGTNPAGLRDALAVYGQAITRFGADSAPTGHEKPWWYYLRMFGWYREGGLVWHQAAFSSLALAGLVVAFARPGKFLRGVAIYTFVIVAAFSFFAYKTPWHTVHFVPGLALLAAGALAAVTRLRTGRFVAVAFGLLVTATLYQQTGRAAFLRPADQRNPYAYVHSSFDVLKYRGLAEAAAARSPEQPIRVISEEYWPLPWYLRGIPRVGFYSSPPEDCDGALVIVSATQADAVRARLRQKYRESFLGLRPGFVCILFTPEP